MIDHYDWGGGREAMLRFGPDSGPIVIAALPLFEEANRTRAFVVTILRALAKRGVAGALPDLPGQGESLMPMHKSSILKMQDAFGFACDAFDRAGRGCYALGVRSGALMDALAPVAGRWHFAPIEGTQLVRELSRIEQGKSGVREAPKSLWYIDGASEEHAEAPPVEIAGTPISPDLILELTHKNPVARTERPAIPLRTVRLGSDPRPADLKIDGVPLWRRAEPDNDPALAERLADDIAAWVRICES